jgi:uncharacterized protein
LRYYFDTSALLKRYLLEAGQSTVFDLLESQGGRVIASELVLPELSSAFRRAANAKRITMEKAHQLLGRAREDLDALSVARLDSLIITRAVHLAMQRDLRALDAIHLATALEIECTHIVSSDFDLLGASKREGLKPIAV